MARAGTALSIGPLGLAAWFGFLVTALNLMPVGQLDGGHVAYAILRRRSLPLSRFVQAMGLVLLWYSPLWLAWMVVMLVIGRRHPPTLADHRPVGRVRVAVGLVALVVFALCFTPKPLLISWNDFLRFVPAGSRPLAARPHMIVTGSTSTVTPGQRTLP